jgi:hypothetical protein
MQIIISCLLSLFLYVAHSTIAAPSPQLHKRQAMTTIISGQTVNLADYVNKHPGGAKFIQTMMTMPDATAYLQSAPHGAGPRIMAIINGLAPGGAPAAPPAGMYKFVQAIFMSSHQLFFFICIGGVGAGTGSTSSIPAGSTSPTTTSASALAANIPSSTSGSIATTSPALATTTSISPNSGALAAGIASATTTTMMNPNMPAPPMNPNGLNSKGNTVTTGFGAGVGVFGGVGGNSIGSTMRATASVGNGGNNVGAGTGVGGAKEMTIVVSTIIPTAGSAFSTTGNAAMPASTVSALMRGQLVNAPGMGLALAF